METFFSIACEHAHAAHWIFFLLIMLAGLNVPISEDIILITAGALASTGIFEQSTRLFIWLFLACWFSAWEAYWLGRLLGPKLFHNRWFGRILTLKRIERIHNHYEKFGFLTFIVGRFIPGGVRNALFMTSGLGKMPFLKFILRDLPACLLSVSLLFYLGFLFGENYTIIIQYFKSYHLAITGILALSIFSFIIYKLLRTTRVLTSGLQNF
ncbi:MAG: DedA family protein [Waddliaceae bacterium]